MSEPINLSAPENQFHTGTLEECLRMNAILMNTLLRVMTLLNQDSAPFTPKDAVVSILQDGLNKIIGSST